MTPDDLRALADVQPVPAVPAIKERGPWSANREGRHIWIESNDFTHDGRLYVNGDFESNDQRFAYAQEIARRLNAAPATPQAEQPIDLDAIAMQQMRQAAAESTWMPAEYSGSDWISDVCRWLRDGPPQAEPKREPLTALRILEIEADANRKWRDNGRIVEYAVVFTRLIESAHGIGGSDE